jgi:hypothetical protein
MKKIPFLFLMLLFAFCNSPEQKDETVDNGNKDTEKLEENTPKTMYEANFTSEKGRFKCYFPEGYTPEEEINQIKSEDGILNVHSFEYETDVLQYSIRYVDYPQKVLKKFTAQEIMMNVIAGFFANLDLNVTRQDSIEKFDGYPSLMTMGQKNQPEVNGYLYVYRRDIMVDERLYQVALLRLDHYPEPTDFEQFIYTFKLLKEE